MAKKHWLVVGGGFRGIMAAHSLAQRGFQVTLVEAAPVLGGVLYSMEWDGFVIDKGCHLFDNATDELTRVLFELTPQDTFSPVEVSYASALAPDHVSRGLAIVDLNPFDLGFRSQALWEILNAAADHSSGEENFSVHLADRMNNRFGSLVGEALQSAFGKVYQIPADQVSADALDLTVFKRVGLVPDRMGLMLKQMPALDDRLAVSSQSNPMMFYQDGKGYGHRNLYPKSGGLRSWCRLAADRLVEAGCRLRLGHKILGLNMVGGRVAVQLGQGSAVCNDMMHVDQVLWAAGPDYLEQCLFHTCEIETLIHKVPMVLYYFKVSPKQFSGLTYMHDFRSNTLGYRFSAPGLYGRQYDKQGNSYACVEVPTALGSDLWSAPEAFVRQIWAQAQACGLILGGDYLDAKITQTPISYAVPKVGYGQALEFLRHAVDEAVPPMVLMSHLSFSKISILQEIQQLLQHFES